MANYVSCQSFSSRFKSIGVVRKWKLLNARWSCKLPLLLSTSVQQQVWLLSHLFDVYSILNYTEPRTLSIGSWKSKANICIHAYSLSYAFSCHGWRPPIYCFLVVRRRFSRASAARFGTDSKANAGQGGNVPEIPSEGMSMILRMGFWNKCMCQWKKKGP